MALYLDDNTMGFFTSKDLKSWEFRSKLKCFHECPELFALPLDGNENENGPTAQGEYLINDLTAKSLQPNQTDSF
jgi:sucrose-6-phosphate hydrolase SacC (GH32 family)